MLFSVLALVICLSMFVGTTYAWFTDSVTSADNVIQSGNLDIKMSFKPYGADNTEWTEVTSTTPIFKEGALYEPGYTEAVWVKVENVGSLAFKYHLFANILGETEGVNQAGDTFKLSEHLVLQTTPSTDYKGFESFFTTVDSLKSSALKEVAIDSKMALSTNSVLFPVEDGIVSESYVLVVLHMPTTVGNVANHDGVNLPSIDLSVTALATQVVYEEDSFDNKYDANAKIWTGEIPTEKPDSLVLEVTGDKTGTITVNDVYALVYLNSLAAEWGNYSAADKNYSKPGNWTVELGADIDLYGLPIDSINIAKWGKFEGNGHTLSNVVLRDGEVALFGSTDAAISNLTVDTIRVYAPETRTIGAISARATGGSLTNVHVKNADVTGQKYVGGIVGQCYGSIQNCSITDSSVKAIDKTVGGIVGYVIKDGGTAAVHYVTGNTVENVSVEGAFNVGGLAGQAQNSLEISGNTLTDVSVTSTSVVVDGDPDEVRSDNVVARQHNLPDGAIKDNTLTNVTITNK